MTPSFRSDPKLLQAQMMFLRIARVVAPIVVLLVTVILGMRFGAFESSYSSKMTSTFEGTLNLGLPLFPAGTFFILQGLARRVRRRESKLWPALTGHIMETKYRLTYLRGGPFVDFWYVVNGRRHEGCSIQYSHVPRSKSPYRAGMSVELRVDPENPDVAVFASGDDAARFYIWAGVVALGTPPIVSGLLVWLSN
jgi:hypothetical protein